MRKSAEDLLGPVVKSIGKAKFNRVCSKMRLKDVFQEDIEAMLAKLAEGTRDNYSADMLSRIDNLGSSGGEVSLERGVSLRELCIDGRRLLIRNREMHPFRAKPRERIAQRRDLRVRRRARGLRDLERLCVCACACRREGSEGGRAAGGGA